MSPLFLPNEVKLETLTNGKLKQTTTIAFERWTKSDLHEKVRLFVPRATIGSMQIRKSKLRFVNKIVLPNIRRTIKSLAKQAETHQSRLQWSTYFATERTNVMERWKSLTSDENRNNVNLIKVTNRRETSSEVKKITKTPNERFGNKSFVYKLNVNRCNLSFATVSKNVLSEDKTKDIKSTLTEYSVG
ncbi:MAG: hypothetical protein ACTS4W_00710 [Candidatus Hodgkinia cicadicola]